MVFQAAEGKRVRLLGGRILDEPQPVTGKEILERLSEKVRDRVRQWDLRASGLTDCGRLRSRGFNRPVTPSHMELFSGGRRMTLARWPNLRDERIVKPVALDPAGDEHGGARGLLEPGFHYRGDRPRGWRDLEDVWVHGFWTWNWANSYEQVDAIDLDKRIVRTRPPHGLYGFRAGQRFYYVNILEELDRTGEYYVDRRQGILYFLPPRAGRRVENAVSVLEEPMILLKGASHVEFRGLTLEYGRADGIRIEGGEGVRISGCTIRNLGNYGVVVNGGARHSVAGCTICRTGDGGIILTGGERRTLTPARHEAVGNHVHHFGEWSRCYRPAIAIGGVGIRAADNLVHDAPHSAIHVGGNDHVVERNHVYRVCLESGDVGAFYIGRDYSMRGNVVRHNVFHDLGGVGGDSSAIYVDDSASGMTILGNLMYRCFRGVFLGGGVDNLVDNNVFVDCRVGIHVDGRGLSRSEHWHSMVYVTMKQRLEAMNYLQPPYSEHYPELARLRPYLEKPDGVPPYGTRLTRNIAWKCGKWLEVCWEATPDMLEKVARNLTDTDPQFADPERDDYSLRPESPAYALGFEDTPVARPH